jgi:Peptidase inhibitor family I36.
MSKIRKAIVVLVAALGITFVAATPAHAGDWLGCSASPERVCAYWDADGSGSVYYWTGPFNTCIDIGEPWDEDISSVWNRFSGWRVQFYTVSESCTGFYVVVDPGKRKDYGPYWAWNDSFDSMKIVPS